MADLVRGRNPSQRTLPEEVMEYMCVHETGMTFEEVRNMTVKDRHALNIMAQFSFNAKLQKGL